MPIFIDTDLKYFLLIIGNPRGSLGLILKVSEIEFEIYGVSFRVLIL